MFFVASRASQLHHLHNNVCSNLSKTLLSASGSIISTLRMHLFGLSSSSSSLSCLSNGQGHCWDRHFSLDSVCTTPGKGLCSNSNQREELRGNNPQQPPYRCAFRSSSGPRTGCPCRVWMPRHTDVEFIHCSCPAKSIEILTASREPKLGSFWQTKITFCVFAFSREREWRL